MPVLHHAYHAEAGVDGGRVCIDPGTGAFDRIEPFRGYSREISQTSDAAFTGKSGGGAGAPQWIEERSDLSPYAGSASVRILFDFESNGYDTVYGPYAGWFIDDIVVGEPAVVGAVSAPFDPTPVSRTSRARPRSSRARPRPGTSRRRPRAGVGPGAAASGQRCTGTSMLAPVTPAYAHEGRYPDDVGKSGNLDGLTSAAAVSLAGKSEAILTFSHFLDLENRYDGGRVAVAANPGGPWMVLAPRDGYPAEPSAFILYTNDRRGFTGTTSAWHRCSVDLTPALAALGSDLYIAFELATDDTNFQRYDGWFVDDVRVCAR